MSKFVEMGGGRGIADQGFIASLDDEYVAYCNQGNRDESEHLGVNFAINALHDLFRCECSG